MRTSTDEIILIYNHTKNKFIPYEIVGETGSTFTILSDGRRLPRIVKRPLCYIVIYNPDNIPLNQFLLINEEETFEDKISYIEKHYKIVYERVNL